MTAGGTRNDNERLLFPVIATSITVTHGRAFALASCGCIGTHFMLLCLT